MGSLPQRKGTITHSGTALFGHYRAFVRSCHLAASCIESWFLELMLPITSNTVYICLYLYDRLTMID